MTKIERYHIVSGYGTEELSRTVREHMELGWKLVGGVAVEVTPEGKYNIYYQAMLETIAVLHNDETEDR